MTTYKGLKPDYVQLTLPLKRIKQETENMIKQVSINVPTITIDLDETNREVRVSINIDFDSIPDEDAKTIHERTGLREDGEFDNGDYILKEIFDNVPDFKGVRIVEIERDSELDPDAPYIVVEIPFESYAEEAIDLD